jgi:hypothetical protein
LADIFSEVEEELRRDKYNALLRRYGLWVAGVSLLLILAVALHQMVWEPMRNARIYRVSDTYDAALALSMAGQNQEADAAFAEIAAGDHDGYAALALVKQAEIAEAAGDISRAAALYAQAGERADDEALAGLAQIKALYAMADEASYDEILARAESLANADSPYQFSARELIAAAAVRAGDLQRATREYQYLSLAPETPPGIRTRATEGLAAAERATATTQPPASEPAPAAAAEEAPAPAEEQAQPAEDSPQ